jgi:hypothetical protein
MNMPYSLQRLPAEALEVLRFLARLQESASPGQIEAGTGLSNRMVLRAIRRLVTGGQIELLENGYCLTTDGKVAAQQLRDHDAAAIAAASGSASLTSPRTIARRLVVVLPRSGLVGLPATLFFGVNAPASGDHLLPATVRVELRVSASGGSLSAFSLLIDVPPQRAADPGTLRLTPAQPGRAIRVRVDTAQIMASGTREPLGGIYFDMRVPLEAANYDPSPRAVGMDLLLKVGE